MALFAVCKRFHERYSLTAGAQVARVVVIGALCARAEQEIVRKQIRAFGVSNVSLFDEHACIGALACDVSIAASTVPAQSGSEVGNVLDLHCT